MMSLLGAKTRAHRGVVCGKVRRNDIEKFPLQARSVTKAVGYVDI